MLVLGSLGSSFGLGFLDASLIINILVVVIKRLIVFFKGLLVFLF